MKKTLFFLVFCLLFCRVSYADIFHPIGAPEKEKATQGVAIPGVDAGTLLAVFTQDLAYLGPKVGPLLDKHGTTTYASATIVTYAPYGLALNVGTTNITPDGFAATVDWNAGQYIPAANVPILQYIQNATIGVGADYRKTDRSSNDQTQVWSASWALTAQVKGTF